MDSENSNDENIVYVSKDKVLMGIRGSHAPEDWLADLGLLSKKFDDWVYNLLDKTPPKGRENPAYKIYLERFKRTQGLYTKLKGLYPDKQFVLGGHSYGGSLIKGLSIANNKEFEGYTYNSFLHPEFNDDHPNIRQKNIFGDIVSLFEKTKDIKKLDHRATTQAGVKIVELATASKIKNVGVGALSSYISAQRGIQSDVLLNMDLTHTLDEYVHYIRPYLNEQKGMVGLTRGTEAFYKQRSKVIGALDAIKDAPNFMAYDFTKKDELRTMIKEFTPNSELIGKADKLLLKEEVLRNVLKGFEYLAWIGQVMFVKDIITELHSSSAFKPNDESLAMGDWEKQKKDNRMRRVFYEKLDEVGLDYN
jgi:hypothetical protein